MFTVFAPDSDSESESGAKTVNIYISSGMERTEPLFAKEKPRSTEPLLPVNNFWAEIVAAGKSRSPGQVDRDERNARRAARLARLAATPPPSSESEGCAGEWMQGVTKRLRQAPLEGLTEEALFAERPPTSKLHRKRVHDMLVRWGKKGKLHFSPETQTYTLPSAATTRKKKPKAAPCDKRETHLEFALKVMRVAPTPMTASEMIDFAKQHNLGEIQSKSETATASLNSRILEYILDDQLPLLFRVGQNPTRFWLRLRGLPSEGRGLVLNLAQPDHHDRQAAPEVDDPALPHSRRVSEG